MILERHPQLPLLVVSDSDTVWLRQPWAYFEQRPAADFFISTDCLSHQVGLALLPRPPSFVLRAHTVCC
jgi:hypothetical protein